MAVRPGGIRVWYEHNIVKTLCKKDSNGNCLPFWIAKDILTST